ncbi:MAG: putative ABC transporter permease [Bacilli bacterium]|nr:putative ABC transporter permease [Bacilli bacterium]
MLNIILMFMLFSIIGYIVEVIYVYIGSKKLINRGFLNGPYIPIYGFGSVLTIICLTEYQENIIIVFFIGMLICSVLEYITSYIMEKLFNKRWWDYSYLKYNINGRIALKNSLLFGIGCIIIIYIISPIINSVLTNLDYKVKIITAVLFLAIFLIDFINSSIAAYKTSKNISKLTTKINLTHKKILNSIKTRLLKAYPYLIKNNEELIEKIINLKSKKQDK